jgi:hypothetical protein
MRVYVIDYPQHAGKWIYKGFQSAWEGLGYDVFKLNAGNTLNEMSSESLANIDTTGDYIVMYPDALCNDERIQEVLSKSYKSFIAAQPNAFPAPWGTHPNYRCQATDDTIKTLNKMENVHLWTFGDNRQFQLKWKKSTTVPLAFDSIGYNRIIDKKYKYDVCFVGGWVDNGFNEKKKIMVDIFYEFAKSNLNCGFFVNKNITHEQENLLLSNSKICLNIHDEYQRKLGFDTNERTFKSLGLNGSLVSDSVGQLSRLFPEIKTSLDPRVIVDFTKQWLSFDEKTLESIKEQNRTFILENHCYTNRVEQLLSLTPHPTYAIGVPEKQLSAYDHEGVEELKEKGLIRTESGTTFNDLK